MSDTPKTNSLREGIEHRARLRGFVMPEDVESALELAESFERQLSPPQPAIAAGKEQDTPAYYGIVNNKGRLFLTPRGPVISDRLSDLYDDLKDRQYHEPEKGWHIQNVYVNSQQHQPAKEQVRGDAVAHHETIVSLIEQIRADWEDMGDSQLKVYACDYLLTQLYGIKPAPSSAPSQGDAHLLEIAERSLSALKRNHFDECGTYESETGASFFEDDRDLAYAEGLGAAWATVAELMKEQALLSTPPKQSGTDNGGKE